MGIIDFSKLPLIKSFDKLKYNTQVYSNKHGLGRVIFHYKKDVVIGFSTHRLRFSPDEHDLREVPESWIEKKRVKVSVNAGGRKMSFSAFKSRRYLEKQLIEYKKQLIEIKSYSPKDSLVVLYKHLIKEIEKVLKG